MQFLSNSKQLILPMQTVAASPVPCSPSLLASDLLVEAVHTLLQLLPGQIYGSIAELEKYNH
jgi:hypothetical protein